MTDINKLHRCQRPSWSYRSNYTIRGLITDGITKGATRLNILQTGSDRAHQQTAKAERISRFGCVTNFRRYLVILRTPLVFLQPFVTYCIEVYCNVNQWALTLKTIQGQLLTFYLRQVQHVAKLGQFQIKRDPTVMPYNSISLCTNSNGTLVTEPRRKGQVSQVGEGGGGVEG